MKSKFQLSYSQGRRCGDNTYTIAIPDNFDIEKGAEKREFIAWLPGDGVAEYLDSDIIFFAGSTAAENNYNTGMLTPELCSIMIESFFLQTGKKLSDDIKFIPLKNDYPAGGIQAWYTDECFHYNINLFFTNCIKSMRVQVNDVSMSDIDACDKMVINWIQTMKITKPFKTIKYPDDDSFINMPLTEKLVSEWKTCVNTRFTIISNTLQNKFQNRSAAFFNALGSDNKDNALVQDCQRYVDEAATTMGELLVVSLDALEKISKRNQGNALLKNMYDLIRPAIIDNEYVTVSNFANIDGTFKAKIKDIEQSKSRFLKLDPTSKTEVPLSAFKKLTYNENRTVKVEDITVKIPDGMITLNEYHPKNKEEENQISGLKNAPYGFFAVPKDGKKGFENYQEETFCINLVKPQTMPQLGVLLNTRALKEKGIEVDLESTLVNVVKGFFSQSVLDVDNLPIKCVCSGKDYGIVCVQVQTSTDSEIKNCYFKYFVLYNSDVYQGNIYINAAGSIADFTNTVHNWLKSFVVGKSASSKTPKQKGNSARPKISLQDDKEQSLKQKSKQEKETKKEIEKQKVLLEEKRKSINSKILELRGQHNKEKTKRTDLIKNIEKQIAEQEAELSSLSFFKFSRKKELQQTLTTLYEQRRKYNKELEIASQSYEKQINRLNVTLNLLNPSVKVGDIIKFGYEPYSNTEFIEWIVIKNDDNMIRLLSLHTIKVNSYYSVEKWLSEDFIKTCFTAYWQKLMLKEGNKYSWLPTYSEITPFMKATPSQSLKQYIRDDCTASGRSYLHNDLQINSTIDMYMKNGNSYWIQSANKRDGFADYIYQGQERGRIGAGAEVGVRAVIKIEPLKLLNMTEIPSFKINDSHTDNQNKNIYLSKLIIELLFDRKKYKSTDILEHIENISDFKDGITNQRISAIMRNLEKEGIVKSEAIKGCIYFSLAQNLIY